MIADTISVLSVVPWEAILPTSCWTSFKASTKLVALIWISSVLAVVLELSSMAFPNAISFDTIPVCFAAAIAASPPVIFWPAL